MTFARSLILVAATSLAGIAFAATDPGGTPAMQAQATTDMTDGEVRKVDKDNGKVTLRHGPILNLDMPAMTMVFSVKDKSMLDAMKSGDKVRFKVVNDGGKMTVTEIQAAH